MMLAAAYCVCENSMQELLSLGGVCYLVIHMLFADFTVANHFVSNTLDEVYGHMVYERILEYEEKTGNTVTKFAVMNDIDAPFYYNEVSYTADQINERALGQVAMTMVSTVSGRKFDKIEMPEEIADAYFEGRNWDYIDLDEQLVIMDDTAYWCVF